MLSRIPPTRAVLGAVLSFCLPFYLSCCILSAAGAQTSQSSPATGDSTQTTYPVSGIVLNSLTHEPIARALVQLNDSGVLTDGEGRFELELPAGQSSLTVRRPGYASTGQDSTHALQVGANMPPLTFTLLPQAGITGHVTLSTGEEADGFRFHIYRRSLPNNHERWTQGGQSVTDAEGIFRIQNLGAPGVYILCSSPQEDGTRVHLAASRETPASSREAATGAGYPSVCYPGPVPQPGLGIGLGSEVNAITLLPGQQTEVELTLTRQPFYRVSIAVPNAVGANVVSVEIHDQSGRMEEYSAEWNPQQSTIEMHLPNGHYHSEGADPGQKTYGRIDFQVAGAPVAGLRMTMLPLHPIPVEVHRDFTAPRANLSEGGREDRSQNPEYPGFGITLISADSAVENIAGGGLTAAKGSTDRSLFELEDVLPGRYWVETYANEGYIQSISSGGVDLTREPLLVGPGNSTAPIQVTLRNDVGQIQCSVNATAADTAAGAIAPSAVGELHFVFVYAIPLSRVMNQIPQSGGTGQQAITLPNLPPGSYRVVAFDKYREIDIGNPQQMARIAANGQTVNVAPGGTVNVQLDLVHLTDADAQSQGGDGSFEGPVL